MATFRPKEMIPAWIIVAFLSINSPTSVTNAFTHPSSSIFTTPLSNCCTRRNHSISSSKLLSNNYATTANSSLSSSSSTSLSLSKSNNNNNNNILTKLTNTAESTLAILTDLVFFLRPPTNLPRNMRRVQTQFIAALGDPSSSSSRSGAEQWGIWRIDPGPRGVYVRDFKSNPSFVSMGASGANVMPAGWKFDPNEFWIEEYGRVMEKPDFPVPPGRYLVTGGREATALLTVDPPNERGEQGWRLEESKDDDDSRDGRSGRSERGVTLYDVTHLPCRSARYRPKKGEEGKRSPADADWRDFPVTPGAEMPVVRGCDKLDYAVLFVLAVDD